LKGSQRIVCDKKILDELSELGVFICTQKINKIKGLDNAERLVISCFGDVLINIGEKGQSHCKPRRLDSIDG